MVKIVIAYRRICEMQPWFGFYVSYVTPKLLPSLTFSAFWNKIKLVIWNKMLPDMSNTSQKHKLHTFFTLLSDWKPYLLLKKPCFT